MLSSRLNNYVFIAHAAIVSLALSNLNITNPSVPLFATKLYFTASAVALVLLAIDMAITVVLHRNSSSEYFQLSDKILSAGRENPPRLLTSDEDEADEFEPSKKLLWLANTAIITLVIELSLGIVLVWCQ